MKTIQLAPYSAAFLLVALACKAPAKDSAPAAEATATAAKTAAPKPKPIVVQAQELVGEYKANEVRADARFKGKRLIVIGVADDIKKDVLDSIYVIITAPECVGDRKFTNSARCGIEEVQAFFEDEQAGDAAAINKGVTIAVDCTVEGKMMNVLLKHCTIAKMPDGKVIASGSAEPTIPSAAKTKPKKR